jgi:hypothetical protein
MQPAAPIQQAPAAPPKRVVAAKPVEVPPSAPMRSTETEKDNKPARSMEQAPKVVETNEERVVPPVAEAPSVAPTPTVPQTPATPVTVNLAELNAQIRGYHDGLDEIEATIVARDGKLTEGEVAQLVGQLEQLAVQHQFVRLYYDGLSKSERRFVAAPRSMGETIELVDGQRAALVAEEEDFLTALEGDVAKDELKQRLEAVAKEVGADKE